MKRWIPLVLLTCLFHAPGAEAQIEQGDSEIRFLFFYSQTKSDSYSDKSGSLQLSYGHFFTPRLQLGVGPRITISEFLGDTQTDLSGSVFVNYTLTTASKTVPYLSGEWYQQDFSPEEGMELTDYTYITIGFGVRNFFTEYAALNTAISYGFSLASEAEGGLLMIMSGLSYIF
jgi:hypothetical protein